MKTVVSVNEISEFEIKPKAELAEWKAMVTTEITGRWGNKENWITVNCPVCNNTEKTLAFEKHIFSYVECNHCKTLYAENRPSPEELSWWYSQSDSIKYWQETLLKLSTISRSEKIIEPRSFWVLDGLSEYLTNISAKNSRITDISFFGKGLVEKIAENLPHTPIISAGITSSAEIYQKENITVNSLTSIDDISGLLQTDIIIAIDVLERVSNIYHFLEQLETVVNTGGLVFATCPVSSGFEIQSLWDKSPSIIPPDKLNLPSVNGLINLFNSSSKWEILELSTPGMFDVEVVKKTIAANPNEKWPRTLRLLVNDIDNHGIVLFTEYLQSQRLSSFARIVLQRVIDKK